MQKRNDRRPEGIAHFLGGFLCSRIRSQFEIYSNRVKKITVRLILLVEQKQSIEGNK